MVLLHHLEHRRSGDPGDDRQRDRAESDRREDQMADRVPQGGPVGRDDRVDDEQVGTPVEVGLDVETSDARQPAEAHGERPLEDQGEEEDRHADPDQRSDEADVVERSVGVLGSDDAEWDADDDGEQHRRQSELDGGGEALAELVDDRPLRRHTQPEVAGDDPLEIFPVLHDEWPVESVLTLDGGDRFRVARSPRRAWAGPPGSALVQAKTRNETARSTGMAKSSRRAAKRAMRCAATPRSTRWRSSRW